jgi:hypothetical protein
MTVTLTAKPVDSENKLKSALIVNADDAPTNRLPLPINELLDRFEIMYPNINELVDLRKAVAEQDLSSIFKLCNHDIDFKNAVLDNNLHSIFKLMKIYPVTGHCEDLRKAIVEQDLDSMFRLFTGNDDTLKLYKTAIVNKNIRSIFKILGGDSDDLRKVILNSNYWKIWPLLEKYTNTHFIAAFKSFYVNNTMINEDAFSREQMQSKVWLVDELSRASQDLGIVYLCAGRYATLGTMLFESNVKLKSIRSFDIDEGCRSIAEEFNKPWVKNDWKFKASTKDINTIDFNMHKYEVSRSDGTVCYLMDSPDTIINTSCKHIENFDSWYNKITEGKLVVMQTKNIIKAGDNIYSSLSQYDKSLPMQLTLYLGELKLEKYSVYMKIGLR